MPLGHTKQGYRPRSSQRYPIQGMRTAEGEMIDLSPAGMRFKLESKPCFKVGATREFSIRTGGKQLTVNGRVVWIRRNGLLGKSWQCGVQFSGLKPTMRALLEDIAIHGFIPERIKAPAGTTTAKPNVPQPHSKTAAHTTVQIKMPDLYKILGVAKHASTKQVHEAYRSLAKTTHPDISKADNAAEKFSMIAKAYSVLKDKDKRAGYDRMRNNAA